MDLKIVPTNDDVFVERRAFDLPNVLGIIATAALTISILAGKLAFPRLFGETDTSPHWLEIRLPALLVAAGLVAAILLQTKLSSFKHFAKDGIYFAFSVTALAAYLVVRSLGLDSSAPAIIDNLYLTAQVWLLVLLASNRQWASAIAGTSLATAALLFLLALAGVNKAEINGLGWAPIGGVITFYRIEFLGLCVSLYLYLRGNKPIMLPLIGVFFFATLATLSKAAALSAIVALGIVFAALLARRRVLSLALLFISLAIAFSIWNVRFNSSMSKRISEAFVVFNNPTIGEAGPNHGQDGVRLNPGQDMEIRIDYCLLSAKREECQSKVITDRSGRAVLLTVALSGFMSSPVFGNGLGQYVVNSINVYNGAPEPYRYPHNILAEWMFTGGLVALALAMVMLALAAKLCWQESDRSLPSSAIVSFIVFVFLTALASGDQYDLRLLLCAVVILGARPGGQRSETERL
ncbi:O-antigen ligase family protein [Nitrobacter sp. TKz-YC02]|uniref:O-antigen ligase family protein n=1 Tax=Nitrobacter sp. TKz-YC02 TaxID=3398704 RepID=UPI003CE72344